MSNERTVEQQVGVVILEWLDIYDVTAYDLVDRLTKAGLLRPEPRLWRKGDPEPGEDVRAVLDCDGDVWQPDGDGYWRCRCDGPLLWRWLAFESPLVEVTLPPVVRE